MEPHPFQSLFCHTVCPPGLRPQTAFACVVCNDIVTHLSVNEKLCADDSTLCRKAPSAEYQIRLNNQFGKVFTYCQEWQMKMNYHKTVHMQLTLKKNPFCYQYGTNNISLSEVTEYKYVGLWATNNLTWNKYIPTISGNCPSY